MSELSKAIEVIKQGGIVIYPTDTAFGIGCRVDDEDCVKRLFELRRRPNDKAMPVLFDSIERIKEYVLLFDSDVEKLMEENWPGALTLILDCDKSKIPSLVRGGGDSLGVRIPDHEVILSLIEGADIPIIGTSANFSGEKTPFSFEGLDKALIKLVDFVLEGKTKGRESTSTVVDCSRKPWKIIRQGSVVLPDL